MCVSCGCGMPNEKHGDDRNITLTEIESAAQAAGVDAAQAADNIKKGVPAR